jgi:hypothetical protein
VRVQAYDQRDQHARRQLDVALVAHQVWELVAQMAWDLFRVERLEGAIARLLKQDHDRHDLAGRQTRGTAAPLVSRHEQPSLSPRRETLPKLVHRAIQFKYTHGEPSSLGQRWVVAQRIIPRLEASRLSQTHAM